MKDLDLAIAAQSEKLRYRRYWISQRKRQLRNDALSFCSRPSTLVGAFATGSVLGLLYPPRRNNKSPKPGHDAPSFLQRYISTSLQLLLVNTMTRIFTPPSTTADTAPSELPALRSVENC